MGTHRFREDVSEALKKFMRAHPGQTPEVLKVSRDEAAVWLAAEGGAVSIDDFITRQAEPYTHTIPWQGSRLRCRVEPLDVEDRSPTRFE
jgi:hypothetical protein